MEKPFVDLLPRHLQDNLILDGELRREPAADIVAARIREAEAQARRVREQVLTARLIDAGAASGLGLSRVLSSFEQGRLKTLLVRDGFAKLGRRCGGCQALSLSDSKCARCGAATQILFNLVEELVDRALEQRAEVFRLENTTPLDNLGRIGAELRQTAVTETPAAAPRAAASVLAAARR